MPESPRTRFRRPRAVSVTGDRGRLTGKETTGKPAPKPGGVGPVAPRWSIRRARMEQQVRADLAPLHQWQIRWGPEHGHYQAQCSCGDWRGASWPTAMHRARAGFKDHVKVLIARETIRRRRAAGEKLPGKRRGRS